jgi:hypothetical protein
VSDNWVRDLLILNELENANRRGKEDGGDGTAEGMLILLIGGILLAAIAAYPITLILQYRRKDWIALALTLALLPIAFLTVWPRLYFGESTIENFLTFNSTIGLSALYGYLIYFFCQRINRKIAKDAPLKFNAKSIFVIFSFGFAVLFILWAILASFPFITAPTYWWLNNFMDMKFETLPLKDYVYQKLAIPYFIGGTVLAISPMQAWCRKRLAEGKSSVPTPVLVLAVPAFLFSIFWISVFTRNLFS